MAVKLSSGELEKRALRAYCTPSQATTLLTQGLTADHFVTEVCKAAFARVRFMLDKRGKLMGWRDLIVDPTLSATTKAALKSFKLKPPVTEEKARSLFNNLDAYRQLRGLNNLSKDISEALNRDEKMDVSLTLEMVARRFANITASTGAMELIHMGMGDNSSELVENVLKGTKDSYIRTGFAAFDDRAHGFSWGSLVICAAPTGHGKSTLVRALGKNIALQGVKVLNAGLEMDHTSNMQRDLAAVSGVSLSKIVNPKTLTKVEKDAIRKRNLAFSKRVRKVGGKFTTLANDTENISLDTILTFAKTAHYRVVVIDYIGLLEGSDGDDQVKALGRLTRKAKTWAGANKAIVVFAAQLADDGSKVRYSGAMKEHANALWQFVRSPIDRENKVVRISQTKSRMNEEFDFDLYFDSTTMTVRDLTPEETKRLQSVQRPGVYGSGKGEGKAAKGKSGKGKSKKGGGFSSKYTTDIV